MHIADKTETILHPEHLNVDYVIMKSNLPGFSKTDRYGFSRQITEISIKRYMNVWPVLVAIEDEVWCHVDVFGAELANLCQVNYPIKTLLLRGHCWQNIQEFEKHNSAFLEALQKGFQETIKAFDTIRDEVTTNRYIF